MLKVYSSLRKKILHKHGPMRGPIRYAYKQCKNRLLLINQTIKDNLRYMKDKLSQLVNETKTYSRWPLISASHRGAYADCLNTDKYIQATALNTVIYGNFL